MRPRLNPAPLTKGLNSYVFFFSKLRMLYKTAPPPPAKCTTEGQKIIKGNQNVTNILPGLPRPVPPRKRRNRPPDLAIARLPQIRYIGGVQASRHPSCNVSLYIPMRHILLSCLALLTLSACASLAEDPVQEVRFETPGARGALCTVNVDGFLYKVRPPQAVKLPKTGRGLSGF